MDLLNDTDSSDDENISYLIATGILPGFEDDCIPGSRGSKVGKSENLHRDFEGASQRILHDYFGASPKYGERDFERRFRLPRVVFEKLRGGIEGTGIFVWKEDALRKKGIHPLQRITAALRMLAYGSAADSLDEYLQMSEISVLLSMKEFCHSVVTVFGDEYLREPREADLTRILEINAARGFPGCLGSIDCQHWAWKNCPIAWAGQFTGKEKEPTIVLEAIADGELWIWHAFFGSAGTLNDINVLDRSPTVAKIIAGEFPPTVSYTINEVTRTLPYYLADGIYPEWAIFVKTISDGSSRKEKTFPAQQESIRRDVERAFGVLVSRFHILQRPARLWYREDIAVVMKACIILHNMVVEARRDIYENSMSPLRLVDDARSAYAEGPIAFTWNSHSATLNRNNGYLSEEMWSSMVFSREARITNKNEYFSLKNGLIEHIWNLYGTEES